MSSGVFKDISSCIFLSRSLSFSLNAKCGFTSIDFSALRNKGLPVSGSVKVSHLLASSGIM